MRLLTVTTREAAALQAEDDREGVICSDDDGYVKLRWFKEHGPGAFLVFCCGEATVPEGLRLDPSVEAKLKE